MAKSNDSASMAVSVHSSIPMMLVRALEARNVNAKAILRHCDIDFDLLHDENQRIDAKAMDNFWRMAVDVTKDEAISLEFAQQCLLGSLYGLGFVWVVSDTLKDALQRLVRYFRVICTAGKVSLGQDSKGTYLALEIPVSIEDVFPPSLDGAIALFVQLCRLSYRNDFAPAGIEFQRKAPSDCEKFARFFQCPTLYQQRENKIYFDNVDIVAPLPMSNPKLARANDSVVKEYLAEMERNDLSGQISVQIIELLPSGVPTLSAVANKLFMSPRTLQRKLALEKTNFHEILDDLRLGLAKDYLKNSKRGVGEIAYMLGFTDPANFTRFFKRSTNMKPSEFIESYRLSWV